MRKWVTGVTAGPTENTPDSQLSLSKSEDAPHSSLATNTLCPTARKPIYTEITGKFYAGFLKNLSWALKHSQYFLTDF